MKPVIIDIETAPLSPLPLRLAEPEARDLLRTKVPRNYKKPETIESWISDNYDDVLEADYEARLVDWGKAALDYRKGRITCIGIWFVEESDPVALTADTEEELIEKLDTLLGSKDDMHQWQVTGHNAAGFDLPWLCRAAIRYSYPTVYRVCDPGKWGDKCYDTMLHWQIGADRRHYCSLNDLAKYLGQEGKDMELGEVAGEKLGLPADTIITGSLAPLLAAHGCWGTLQEYCLSDLEITANVAAIMRRYRL